MRTLKLSFKLKYLTGTSTHCNGNGQNDTEILGYSGTSAFPWLIKSVPR
jgi:hypothetical protein